MTIAAPAATALILLAICLLAALILVRDNSGPSTTSTVETFSPAPSNSSRAWSGP